MTQGSTISMFCLLSIFLLALPSCEQRRRPVRYLIPESYAGWVEIDFGIVAAPALPIEDGFYVVKFPPSGRLYTSSDIEVGWAKDRYYYYTDSNLHEIPETSWGGGGLIWGGTVGSQQDDKGQTCCVTEALFVGTEEQFKRHSSPDDHRKPGRIE